MDEATEQVLGWGIYLQIVIALIAGIIMIWNPSVSSICWKIIKTNLVIISFCLISVVILN